VAAAPAAVPAENALDGLTQGGGAFDFLAQ
jgi:hypothetical protein